MAQSLAVQIGTTCAFLLMVAAPARAGDPPEAVLPPRVPAQAADPNEAPLCLLSTDPRLGREGAARIGEARRLAPIAEDGDIAEALGVPRDSLPLRVSLRAPVRLAFRETADHTERGWRVTECMEGRGKGLGVYIAAEKDPGEPGPLDFTAWSLFSDTRKGGTRWVLGDLSVRLGSGLLVGTGASFGAPADFSPDEASRLAPYRSRAESSAHRGIGILRSGRRGALYLLVTSTKRDARVDRNGLVTSIDESGLHRDAGEASRKDRLIERIAAARWESGWAGFRSGWTVAGAEYDPPIGGGDRARKPRAFRGDRLLASSFDLRLERGRTLLSAEVGASSTRGAAGQIFLRRAQGPVRALLRFRNFSGLFHAPRSTAYHRLGGEPSGEAGLLALVSAPAGRVSFTVRAHRYASFGRTFLSEVPVRGFEWAAWADRDGRFAVFSAEISGSSRSEARRGRRVPGESLALSGGVSVERGRLRVRLDVKEAATRSPGAARPKRASGASILARFARKPGETISLTATALFAEERSLAFPSPDLTGAFGFAVVGGGYGEPGLRFAWKGFFAPPWEAALVLGPGRAGFELGLGGSLPDRR